MKEQKHLNGRKANLSKFGHRASGIGHRASGIGHKSALLAALIVSALSLVSLEQSQAQLLLTINPLQGDTNNTTVWSFSGSSTASQTSNISASSATSFGSRGSISPYDAVANLVNLPSGGTQFLTSSAPSRYSSSGSYHSLTANSANRPQVATPSGTRTISHIYLVNDFQLDTVGIRVSGTTPLSYTNGASVSWTGQGTMPYPIGDFSVTAANQYYYNFRFGPYFATAGTLGTPSSGGFRIMVSSMPKALVPEPEEYAFVLGLFALAFVILRRHLQKKQRQTQATPTS